MCRQRVRLSGIVQGVGFRPFVYNLASRYNLVGFVRNTSHGVTIEIQGAPEDIASFRLALIQECPSLARIEDVQSEDIPSEKSASFAIETSSRTGTGEALLLPDIALCPDCLADIRDPDNRRYQYPFTNCTNCGPRFTIVEAMPYDRTQTSMRHFAMCPECRREYDTPSNRRFHAQPNACPHCGPQITLYDAQGEVAVDNPLSHAINCLQSGQIVAVRGIGGYQLAVDAGNDTAVQTLRLRKGRPRKPLALMVRNLGVVREICHVSDSEADALRSPGAPIVLLRARSKSPLARSIAFDNACYGLMLPYTPLHHLLMAGDYPALVMTSANISNEPIIADTESARARLSDIADLFVTHNRDIVRRCDDSVISFSEQGPQIIRRSRGFVPEPIRLPSPLSAPLLAVGGQQKNTVALAHRNRAFVSQHIGDLDSPEAMDFFAACIRDLSALFGVAPERVVHDLHPDYQSTTWARTISGLETCAVQHHHAHLASVLTDNGVNSPAIGVILDGTGLGTDGTIWGGEVLIGSAREYERFAWLEPVVMPGGDAVVRHPWRMALSYLSLAGVPKAEYAHLMPPEIDPNAIAVIETVIEQSTNAIRTSSCGRLFDAVASLMGLCTRQRFEAEAAMALETCASHATNSIDCAVTEFREAGDKSGVLPTTGIIRHVLGALEHRQSAESIAATFHVHLADLFTGAACAARKHSGLSTVALSGGVFQNRVFLDCLCRRLHREGFSVLCHRQVPTNDGGLSLGQIVVAGAISSS